MKAAVNFKTQIKKTTLTVKILRLLANAIIYQKQQCSNAM